MVKNTLIDARQMRKDKNTLLFNTHSLFSSLPHSFTSLFFLLSPSPPQSHHHPHPLQNLLLNPNNYLKKVDSSIFIKIFTDLIFWFILEFKKDLIFAMDRIHNKHHHHSRLRTRILMLSYLTI
jgi:hypothetical protein